MRTAWLALIGVTAMAPGIAAAAGAVKGRVTRERVETPVANAVIMIDAPAAPVAPGAPHALIDQRDMAFVPHVIAVPVGTTVDFPNHDRTLHNVFSASPAKRFDLGMYDPGETRSVTFDQPGVVRLGCNAHPKMEAFVVVHANPHVAVTDEQGAYTIEGVPPGRFRARLWHETLAERETSVTVRDGQVERLDAQLHGRR
jgi:plastocyanin